MLRDEPRSPKGDQIVGSSRGDRHPAAASQLNCLPQDAVHWGHEILPHVVSGLADQGIERPIVFTVERLEEVNRKFVRRHLRAYKHRNRRKSEAFVAVESSVRQAVAKP